MNIQQLRQSVKMKWLSYYEQNRPWLVKIRVWGTYDGLRRPSSGFILATLSVLEPQFDQILSFLSELNNNPDQIVAALGLNFNPEEELDSFTTEHVIAANDFYSQSSEVIHEQFQAVSLATNSNEIAFETPHSAKSATELAYSKLAVPSITVTNGVVRDRQPVSSVAVATQVNYESSAKTLLVEKPASEMILQHQPGRSLAITTEISSEPTSLPLSEITPEIPSKNTTMPSTTMATEVPQYETNLKSLAVAIKVPGNSKPLKIQLPDIPHKVKLSPNTNARSLASWVDEFCQGADWDPEESIFIHF
ncbi:hypothetical protein BV372_13095 [Nostoc sp. T09]|uniref:DUF5331 domain-containing protein n=1 Tax=Nostoc sp. T09 TaxID=1932621 RepID=UPI000A3611AF|nr:DUF5331 domain-containing protein [Nostoc sp. T09]OUL34781.1 hypothetical protein BV372_13095 [Nostoc sp. T09]